jgi:hypothetical protein
MVNPVISATTKVGGKGFLLFRSIRVFLMFLVFGIMIINAVIISSQDKDITSGVKYVGNKLLFATETLGDASNKIIEQNSLYPHTDNGLTDFWSFLKIFYEIFSSIFLIYLWLYVLTYIFLWVPLADDSKKASGFIFACFFFILIQMLAASISGKSIMTPLIAFRDFGKAIVILVQSSVKVVDKIYQGSNTTN